MLLQRDMADVVNRRPLTFSGWEPMSHGFATMNGAYRPKEDQPEELPEKRAGLFINRRGFVVSKAPLHYFGN